MRKVKVLPEVYVGEQDLYYVVSVLGRVYSNTYNRVGPFIPSSHSYTSLKRRNYPIAAIKMRYINVYY